MKTKLKMLKNEVLYLLYSKIIFIFFVALMGVLLLNAYGTVHALKSAAKHFESTKQYYIKQGEDIEQVLKQDLNVKQEQDIGGGIVTYVDNPLRYDFEEVSRILSQLRPKNLSISILEMLTFLFGPFIFGLLGILLSTYDFRYKTVKVKSLKQSWRRNILIKQIVNVASVAVFVVGLFLVSRVLSEAIFAYAKSTVSNVNQYPLPEDAVLQSSVFTKLLVSIFIGVLFSIIGFSFGLVFKSATPPMVILAVYHFFVPSLGKYDLKNLVSVTGHRFFEFNSDLFCLFQPVKVNSIIAIGILLLIVASLGFTNLVIARKQSKYVV